MYYFCERRLRPSNRLFPVNYFREKASLWMFDRVLNMFLDVGQILEEMLCRLELQWVSFNEVIKVLHC